MGFLIFIAFHRSCKAALQMMKTETPEPHVPCIQTASDNPALFTISAQAHEVEELALRKRRAFWDQVFPEKEAVGFPGGRAWKKGLKEEPWTTVEEEVPHPSPCSCLLLWFESKEDMGDTWARQGRIKTLCRK